MIWDSDGGEVFGYLAYSNVTSLCSIFPIRAGKPLYMTLAFLCRSHGCGTPSSIARPHAPRSLHRPCRPSAKVTCPLEGQPAYDENFRVTLAMTVIGALGRIRSSEKIAMEGVHILCKATTLNMNPRESTSTTTGSTLSPGDSSVYNPRLGYLSSALRFY